MKRAGLIELNAVVAVAAQRSFRKAAAELGMSPSALSHAVSSLEERMGVRLFNRTTRSVALSEAGAQFLARVSPALEQITDAMAGVNEFRDTPSGTIRLNASEGAAQILLAPVVLEFLRRYPDMQVDIVTEGRMVDIVAEGFDAGIRAAEHVPLDMVAVDCSPPIRFVVAGAPSYFAGRARPQTPGDLHSHTCIRTRLPGGALYRWEFQRGADKIEIDPAGPLTLDNHHLMTAAAVQGAGLIWTSEWHVAELVAAGKLETVLQPWSPQSSCLRLYYPTHRHVPAGMKAFLEILREVAGSYKAPAQGR
ncbi:LysR substrate-binding domain-containing protein [Undibacterium sp. TJN25]|uniref:LysR substrate-binding domain-containing protein n=1 Tax=Undibacterium sp. TJN25 TaxID=3413056 RepID=UPI003BF1E55B